MAYKASITVKLDHDETGESLQLTAVSHRISTLDEAGEKIGAAVTKALESVVGYGDAQKQKLAAATAKAEQLQAELELEKAKANVTATATIAPVYEEPAPAKKYGRRSTAS